MTVLKLLVVDDSFYTKASQLESPSYTWQVFHEADAHNLILNSYIVMCLPISKWCINPYIESIFPVQCAYIRKVNLLLSRSAAIIAASDEEKYELANLLLQRLDIEAVRRGLIFESCSFSKKNALLEQVEQQTWDNIDRTFLQAQKEDLLKLFHLMNAQCFLERLVDELLVQLQAKKKKPLTSKS
ncbi:MAG: hypothetical protein UHX00_10595 [Caryophanon sp.]|nr:hypothetical protein [Caryophanon sp.]